MTDGADLWEQHAALVAGGLHRGRRPGVRGADPAAGGTSTWPAPSTCSTSGAARVRSPGWPRRSAPAGSVGVDPTWAQIAGRRRSGAAVRPTPRSGAGALPFRPGAFDAVVACLVFEHIRDVDDAIAEVARVLRPGGRFVFFLNHPLLQTPEQRLDRRPDARPARAVLADRALPGGGRDDRGGREGRVHPLHPPAAVAVRQRHGRQRPGARGTWTSRPRHRASSPGPRSTPRRPPSLASWSSSPNASPEWSPAGLGRGEDRGVNSRCRPVRWRVLTGTMEA